MTDKKNNWGGHRPGAGRKAGGVNSVARDLIATKISLRIKKKLLARFDDTCKRQQKQRSGTIIRLMSNYCEYNNNNNNVEN